MLSNRIFMDDHTMWLDTSGADWQKRAPPIHHGGGDRPPVLPPPRQRREEPDPRPWWEDAGTLRAYAAGGFLISVADCSGLLPYSDIIVGSSAFLGGFLARLSMLVGKNDAPARSLSQALAKPPSVALFLAAGVTLLAHSLHRAAPEPTPPPHYSYAPTLGMRQSLHAPR